MKKIIFSKKVKIESTLKNWHMENIEDILEFIPTYNQYPTISDQEIEVWEHTSEPWNLNEIGFKKIFEDYIRSQAIKK